MKILDKMPGHMLKALAPLLRSGSLYVRAGGGYDQYGNPIAGAETAHPIRGIVESFSIYAARNGLEVNTLDEDYAILFMLDGVPVDPSPDDQISIDGPRGQGIRYRITSVVEIDPARVHSVVRARET